MCKHRAPAEQGLAKLTEQLAVGLDMSGVKAIMMGKGMMELFEGGSVIKWQDAVT